MSSGPSLGSHALSDTYELHSWDEVWVKDNMHFCEGSDEKLKHRPYGKLVSTIN